MRKRRLSKKEELLRLFIRGSQENNCYTVQDLCRKIGVPYEKVLQWARNDYRWRKPDEAVGENRADLLEECRRRCWDNVEMAMMLGRIKAKEGLKYMNMRQFDY